MSLQDDVISDALGKYLNPERAWAAVDAAIDSQERIIEKIRAEQASEAEWLAWRKNYAKDINFWVTRRNNELILNLSHSQPSELLSRMERNLPPEYFDPLGDDDKKKAYKLLTYCTMLQNQLNMLTMDVLPNFQQYIEARTKRASEKEVTIKGNTYEGYTCKKEEDEKYSKDCSFKRKKIDPIIEELKRNTGLVGIIGDEKWFFSDVMDDSYLKVCFLFAATLIVRASAMYRVLPHVTDELREIFDRNGLLFDLRANILEVLGKEMDNFATKAPYLASTNSVPLWKELDYQEVILTGINAIIDNKLMEKGMEGLKTMVEQLKDKTPESISQRLRKAIESNKQEEQEDKEKTKELFEAVWSAQQLVAFEGFERIATNGGREGFRVGR